MYVLNSKTLYFCANQDNIMSKKAFLIFSLFVISLNFLSAQNKYWIYFTDKDGVTFDPYQYFDQKAIDRRIKHGLDLYDKSDYPVKQQYLQAVAQVADSLSHHTRWFNAVAAYANESEVQQIIALPFVKKVTPFPENHMQLAESVGAEYDTVLSRDLDYILEGQLLSMDGDILKQHNIDGSGSRVAVFDGGFPGVDELPMFAHLRKDGRILKTYDFAKNKEEVYHGMSHGTMVLSNIAGKIGDKQLGLATGAEFLLARTEIWREPFSEEENWLAAMEWADKHGADIINSSLGYTYHRYYPAEMDGQHSLVAKAANKAVAKGMLVVNAAGNDGGDDSWTVIGTPADADSVLAVGGVQPTTGYHISFSSFGPTADGRRKPNVAAFGEVVVAGKNKLKRSFGTSFASPLVAGFAACALQAFPHVKAMELFRLIEECGALYPYYDYAHGYGIPQGSILLGQWDNPGKTVKIIENDQEVIVRVDSAIMKDEQYADRSLLYYNLQGPDGILDTYYVVEVQQTDVIRLQKAEIKKGMKLNVNYVGYSATYQF